MPQFLRAVAAGSGLAPNQMRSRLLARMPSASPASLKRNWNRWLHGAKAGNPLPTVGNLIAIARAAKDLGWLKQPMSADARGLAQWLLSQERMQRAQMQKVAAQVLNRFIDDLLGEVDFRLYDVEEALESLFATFAAGVARHVLRSSSPGDQGLSESVRRGAEKALEATSATLVELADTIEENEFAPVAHFSTDEAFTFPIDAGSLMEQQRAMERPSPKLPPSPTRRR